VRVGASAHDSIPTVDGVENYLFTIGFLPGLELGGRVSNFGQGLTNDLSFNAKYSWTFDNGFALAVGGQDIGGEARNFRSRYVVATLPWRTLRFTAGYDAGPDVLDGAIGGLEWRPWSFLGVYAEYDAEEVNPGLRLSSGPLWAGLRIGANVGHRGATDEVEGGVQVSIPLGKSYSPLPTRLHAWGEGQGEGQSQQSPSPAPSARPLPTPWGEAKDSLRAVLEGHGFESVRIGTRGAGVLVVSLENRRYNHSSADGIGLALGAIATHAGPGVERIELMLWAYGVPQLVVAVPAQAYRDFLRDGVAAPDLLDARYVDGPPEGVAWQDPVGFLKAAELVVEPVLRTFVGTEFGMLDAGVGARARLTVPLDRGVVGHIGVQAPLLLTDDFRSGENFEGFAPEAGLDQLLLQFAHKPAPSWTSLWSVGLTQVFRVDLRVLANEQLWVSPEGRHRLNAKVMLMDAAESHNVALAGYTWFDAARRWSAGVTAGQFYDNDSGARFDLGRYFGDTIAGVFLKLESSDNMAGGFQLSLPLTPRRDAEPRGVQVKGPRRWGHSLQTTLNLADGTNALRPLMLYEPLTDLDLRRDFLDSGRLGPEWLRGQLPRMREAWLLWGGS
jgi:hypothetical protein